MGVDDDVIYEVLMHTEELDRLFSEFLPCLVEVEEERICDWMERGRDPKTVRVHDRSSNVEVPYQTEFEETSESEIGACGDEYLASCVRRH